MKSKYVIFEGAEGVGKSALSKVLAEKVGAVWTYEPYGGDDQPICKTLRQYCKSKDEGMTPMSRELMLLASRSISLTNIVRKYISEGKTVVSDRSLISGMVYAKVEDIGFEQWWKMLESTKIVSQLLDAFCSFQYPRFACVVMIHSKEYKPVGGSDDRYDSKGQEFFEQLETIYQDALDFISKRIWLFGDVLHFMNDMTKPIDENVERLLCCIGERGM